MFYLIHVAQMQESDLKVVEQLLSVSLRDVWNWARVGFDDRQQMANRFFKKDINKKTGTALEELAPITGCRDMADGEAK